MRHFKTTLKCTFKIIWLTSSFQNYNLICIYGILLFLIMLFHKINSLNNSMMLFPNKTAFHLAQSKQCLPSTLSKQKVPNKCAILKCTFPIIRFTCSFQNYHLICIYSYLIFPNKYFHSFSIRNLRCCLNISVTYSMTWIDTKSGSWLSVTNVNSTNNFMYLHYDIIHLLSNIHNFHNQMSTYYNLLPFIFVKLHSMLYSKILTMNIFVRSLLV